MRGSSRDYSGAPRFYKATKRSSIRSQDTVRKAFGLIAAPALTTSFRRHPTEYGTRHKMLRGSRRKRAQS
jgi:hypothetical protein